MSTYKHLRQFKKEDLLFDENETRIILKFIFEPADYDFVDSLTVSDQIRGFAQGLLVEAIDASYAVGFVEAIFRSTATPSKGAMDVIKKFGRRAAKHWFKHASVHDLHDIKIYDFVRVFIANQFRKPMKVMVNTASFDKQLGAFLAYKTPSSRPLRIWG